MSIFFGFRVALKQVRNDLVKPCNITESDLMPYIAGYEACIKEVMTVSESLSCDLLDESRFLLIANAAKIFLATPGSKAIFERPVKHM